MVAGPLDCGDQLGRTDVAISIGIDQREHAFVELQSVGRTAQSDPELLVEIAKIEKIIGSLEAHLIESAGAEKFPDVFWMGVHD